MAVSVRLEQRLHPVGRTGELEPPRQLHHLELGGAVLARQRLEHFRRVGLGQPGGRAVHQLPHSLVVEPRQPTHQGRQRLGPELLEQLRQLLFGGVHRRFVQRLDQLGEGVPL